MPDPADPSRNSLPETARTGFAGALYLALAGLAMTAWIALLAWLAALVIAEF